MVGTRQGTNTYGKENKNVKKVKKSSKDDKAVVYVHGVKMKGIMIGGMTDGQVRGLYPIKCLKELKKKKHKKIGDFIPFTMVDLIRKA